MKNTRGLIICVCVMMAVAGVFNVSANDTPKAKKHRKWEFGAGISIYALPDLDSTYTIFYSPEFFYPGVDILTSRAYQVLNMTHKKRAGLNLMLNHMITDKFGIQWLGEFNKIPLEGSGNIHEAFLRYIDVPYPALKEVIYSRGYQLDVEDTEGHLQQQSYSLNLLKRFKLGRGMTVDLSGGPSIFKFNGKIGKIGFIGYQFHHFVQVMLPFQNLEGTIESTTKLGLNIGADLNAAILTGVCLYFSGRFFYCPKTAAQIGLSIGPDAGNTNAWTLTEMTRILNPPPLEVMLSFFRLSTGLKFTF